MQSQGQSRSEVDTLTFASTTERPMERGPDRQPQQSQSQQQQQQSQHHQSQQERGGSQPRHSAQTIAASGDCHYCGGHLPDGRRITFCPHCGQNLTVPHCPACSTELELAWKFCTTCGRGVAQ
jgi:predicted amidophosphoribosyltransferase